MRQLVQAAIDLIKRFEGFESSPYADIGGVWTQGYGRTEGITSDSPPITQEIAESWLVDDLRSAQQIVEGKITVDLNDNQYGALVSLVYNCGKTPLDMHLGVYVNQGNFDLASAEFPKWDHDDGKVVQGLLNRRLAEQALFDTPV